MDKSITENVSNPTCGLETRRYPPCEIANISRETFVRHHVDMQMAKCKGTGLSILDFAWSVEFDIESIESWQSAEIETSKQTRKTTPVSFGKRLSTFWNWNKHGSTQLYHSIVMRFHSAIRRHKSTFGLASWRWLGITVTIFDDRFLCSVCVQLICAPNMKIILIKFPIYCFNSCLVLFHGSRYI